LKPVAVGIRVACYPRTDVLALLSAYGTSLRCLAKTHYFFPYTPLPRRVKRASATSNPGRWAAPQAPVTGQAALGCGWFGCRFTQWYAAKEFFQKNFSATSCPLPVKYS